MTDDVSSRLHRKHDFIAFVSDDTSTQVLKQAATNHAWQPDAITTGTIKNAIEHLKTEKTPSWLLVEVESEDTAFDEINALADVCEPGVNVIITGTINSFTFYNQLQEMGIQHYY